MDILLNKTINLIAEKIKEAMPEGFENEYYKKMTYSNINIVSKMDLELLRDTISFEVAFIHFNTFLFVETNKNINMCYFSLLKKLDNEKMFTWFRFDDEIIDEIKSKIKIDEYEDIYRLINLHDTLIQKNVKKNFGQFYTPLSIVSLMTDEVSSRLNKIKQDEKIVDPACGTGVFIVQAIMRIKKYFKMPLDVLEYIERNIYGFDINPFAVVATKLNIIYSVINLNKQQIDIIRKYIIVRDKLFSNIMLKNTISENDDELYDIILGNPPYFKLTKLHTKELNSYKEIVYGQPNIYSFFVFWGIKHLKNDGTMCFVVPQSIRSGLYFKELRALIKEFLVKSIIHIESRQNIFDRAEQAVLILCLVNRRKSKAKTKVQFYNSKFKRISNFRVEAPKVMLNKSQNNIFVLCQSIELYKIIEKVYKLNEQLNNWEDGFKFANGLYVWNQHKKELVDTKAGSIPIIYGGNIQPLKFSFEQCSTNDERKQYSILNDKNSRFLLSGKKLLVQRTTNFDNSIRVKSCLIDDEFLDEYDTYFLENHINYLSYIDDKNIEIDEDTLLFFLGVLNSKFFNMIFVSRSGNTQVSSNELNALPYPVSNKELVVSFVKEHQKVDQFQRDLDVLICKAYGLSDEEINFVINY